MPPSRSLSALSSPESVGALAALAGRTVVMTGGTRGIGRSIVQSLARNHCRVLVGVRDPERANALRQEVERAHASRDVDCLPLDLGALESVSRFAADVRARVPRLDALILNAAVVTAVREVTADGLERQFAVNHLAGMLLATELLPSLRAAARPTIVFVSSLASGDAPIDFDDLQGERSYDRSVAYARSKLANVMCARALARREPDVTVLSLHPGVVRTGLLAQLMEPDPRSPRSSASVLATARRVRARVRSLLGRTEPAAWWDTPEVAAERVVSLLARPPLSGAFVVDGMPRAVPAQADDDVAVQRLWIESDRLIRAALGRQRA